MSNPKLTFNRAPFFDGYREAFGSLNASQVNGLNFLLGKLEQDTFSLKQIAYILATIAHETAHTFQPIRERRGRVGTKIRGIQDRYWGTGFYGRGYVQITWDRNYAKFGIAENPDKALEPETAYEIVSRGMREGMFTGKRLSDYINGQADYFNARKIVNGLDKAGEIAAKARAYESILSESSKGADTASGAVEEDKGLTTSNKPSTETEGTPPPALAAEVKASEVSLLTRITSVSIPASVIAAVGAVINFAKALPPYAWIALALIVVVAMVIGYLVWRDRDQQAHERTKIVLNAAADPEKNNLRLV